MRSQWWKSAVLLAVVLMLPSALATPLAGQDRSDTLLVVMEGGPNSMDIHGVGANFQVYGVTWNVYDRLLTYGRKTLPDGTVSYDYTKLEPELATRWWFSADGMSVTFHLRRDAKFHDGTPVTAHDVKWSFDRAVTVGGFPTFQMNAGSLEKPEQFEALSDHTFRIKFLRRDKLTLPNLAVPVPVIINSALAKRHATPADPWAMGWLRNNAAGGGAYRVESWRPGQETVYVRNDEWKSGPSPKIRRVVVREVPSAGSRRALIERGDADIVVDLPARDFVELAKAGNLRVIGTPVENAMMYVGLNAKHPPFSDVRVRQAVAYALPRKRIVEAATFGRSGPLVVPVASNTFGYDPKMSPYTVQNLSKAKALMAQSGFPNGFDTTLSFNAGFAATNEPMAILLQEALRLIGINATINKIPGAVWRGALLRKDLPVILNVFSGWLNYPEYFYLWVLHGQNSAFNTSSYQNPEMDRLIDAARFETDQKKYAELVRESIKLALHDVPILPLFQPSMDIVMQKNVSGYVYWFHRQIDFRSLAKN